MTEPPYQIRTYCMVPELSASSEPPYVPSPDGRPSMESVGPPAMVALPSTMTPPQAPDTGSWDAGRAEVKVMGLEAVPAAMILAPCSMTRAGAAPETPVLYDLMVVPASMVRVAPFLTNTCSVMKYVLDAERVVEAVISPLSTSSAALGMMLSGRSL